MVTKYRVSAVIRSEKVHHSHTKRSCLIFADKTFFQKYHKTQHCRHRSCHFWHPSHTKWLWENWEHASFLTFGHPASRQLHCRCCAFFKRPVWNENTLFLLLSRGPLFLHTGQSKSMSTETGFGTIN